MPYARKHFPDGKAKSASLREVVSHMLFCFVAIVSVHWYLTTMTGGLM